MKKTETSLLNLSIPKIPTASCPEDEGYFSGFMKGSPVLLGQHEWEFPYFQWRRDVMMSTSDAFVEDRVWNLVFILEKQVQFNSYILSFASLHQLGLFYVLLDNEVQNSVSFFSNICIFISGILTGTQYWLNKSIHKSINYCFLKWYCRVRWYACFWYQLWWTLRNQKSNYLEWEWILYLLNEWIKLDFICFTTEETKGVNWFFSWISD